MLRRVFVDFGGLSLKRKFLGGLEPEAVHMLIGEGAPMGEGHPWRGAPMQVHSHWGVGRGVWKGVGGARGC